MKIVITTPVYYPQINGVAVFSHNLARGLSSRGHEVLVITPSQTGIRHVSKSSGVKVAYLDATKLHVYPDQIHAVPKKKKLLYKHSLRASVMPGRQMRRILSEFQPDVIHVQGSDPIGVAASRYAKKHGIPLVMTEHNQPEVLTESLPLPGVLKRPANKVLSSYFRKRLARADFMTMPTELAFGHLFKTKEIEIPFEAISNGVDLTAFKPGEASDALYRKYDIPRGVPIVLYVGRLDPEKRVSVVLKAFRDFSQKCDNNKLDSLSKTLFVVVGDGVDKSHLAKEALKMGLDSQVKFLGRVTGEDLYNIYRMGDIFVTASEIETQGIVLIEAAATGLPLIAVDAGAVSEVCRDGVNGYLLKPGDASGISEAMFKLLSDPRLLGQMSKNSIEIASEHSFAKTLDRFIEIYDNLCKKGLKTK
ncbi:glycosyltransferase [Candidatus Saccharibacteria bacterium]|nr:glycosyltransferase [Candidatus Saccharibacteria bacterium]